jgi:HB1, ASXL, restriction endonuclease HTH domain
MRWEDAIKTVLQSASNPMHYTQIAEEIGERGLRPEGVGATPANTVASILGTSINNDPHSPFNRVAKGIYALKDSPTKALLGKVEQPLDEEPGTSSQTTGVVNAFGMFWERSKILWQSEPRLFGQQQTSSKEVDFCNQKAVYMLHDSQGVVYVGRVTDQSLGRRLYQHTTDRLGGRWTRFSWFGVYPVNEDGSLNTIVDFQLNIDIVIVTMEAVLIEGLEPRQNRKRGDDFQAVEFLQFEDPKLQIGRKAAVVQELLEQIKAP